MKPIEELIEVMKKICQEKIELNSSGNISIRLPDGRVAIKPKGMPYSDVTTENISIVDIDGNTISGNPPSSDLLAHLIIYQKRPNIHCIIHTHSHFATVFAVLGIPINVFSTLTADYFGEPIECLSFVNHREENFGLSIAQSKKEVFLLGKHGAILLGNSIQDTVKRVFALEESAKINYHVLLLANNAGIHVDSILNEDIQSMRQFYVQKY